MLAVEFVGEADCFTPSGLFARSVEGIRDRLFTMAPEAAKGRSIGSPSGPSTNVSIPSRRRKGAFPLLPYPSSA